MAPLACANRDPGALVINVKKHQWRAPWWGLMEIQERTLSTLKNIDDGHPSEHHAYDFSCSRDVEQQMLTGLRSYHDWQRCELLL
jgi:hypothetical protein